MSAARTKQSSWCFHRQGPSGFKRAVGIRALKGDGICAHLDGIDHLGVKAIGYDGWLAIEFVGWGLPDLAAAPKVWRDLAESSAAIYRDGEAHIRESMTAADLR